ncbi:MAG: DUF222 domain-containing protein, partial [Actinobacteria bacterium]|nr:DUF222 domain-containing protein [Actinomycetota bacterium]
MFAMTGAQAKALLGPVKPAGELSATEAQRYEAQRARTLERLDLEDEITTQQAELNAGTARLVSLLGRHLSKDFWKDHDGLTSPATFLTWKLGQTPAEAARILDVATKLEDFSLIRESFATGELSFPQVKILVSVAEPETEAELVELARNLSGAQLSRFAGHYRSALRLQQDSAHKERYLSTRHNDDGSWTISGRLASEHGALIDKALDQAMDEMR